MAAGAARNQGFRMTKDPIEIIKAAINATFVKYPREDDPHWSNNWIRPEECAHLTNVIMLELNANGLQIVNKNG
jgi:hypothetical protein